VSIRRRVRRTRDGTFQVRLPDAERQLLVGLVGQLREMLVSGETDGLQRLFPPAYGTDDERNTEWEAITHDELLDKRLGALDALEQTAGATAVDEAQLEGWMGAINDVRLVLGTRLDVTDDRDELDDLSPDDPRAPGLAVYAYLTSLLGEIVHALADW
jgi:Domain of unknown function (DUF2017)